MNRTGATPTPEVSVVIPTYRRPALLARGVEQLLAQTIEASRYEVVIVDDGHDDATRDRVDALRRAAPPGLVLRYVRPAAGRGPAVARNAGWRAAKAPLVAFTDDDTLPAVDWLADGLAAMAAHPACSALCGRIVVPRASTAGRPTDHELMTMGLESAEFVTANAFVRRAALINVGGFDERFTRAWREDSDLQFRLMQNAGPVERIGAATVLHPARAERWGISLRQQKNAYFEALLYRKHPRLYRERIDPGGPPWSYYGIVLASSACAAFMATGRRTAATLALLAAAALIARFALRRLEKTSREPAHIWEMLATSAAIPFLSVYWRLRGAWRFRVAFV